MATPSQDHIDSRSVTVDVIDGKWVVTILENFDTSVHDFEIESFARSFADGQRFRLGLPSQD
ncbi:hypothetical protein [Rhizobium sp.]